MIYVLQLALSFMALAIGLAVMLVSAELVLLMWRRRPPELRAKPKSVDPVPESLAEWFEQESEPWARDQLRTEAEALHKSGATWEDVELTLKQLYGGPTSEETRLASERAWSVQPETVPEDFGI